MVFARMISLLLVISPFVSPAVAQTGKETAIAAMNKLALTYKSFPYLSFDLNYYCSSEESPVAYIDSLKGQVKLHGSNCWYVMDSTETIAANGLTITLFKEDKILYLTRSSAALQVANPAALFDSMLSNKDITCSLIERKDEQVIVLDFSSGANYKKIEYHINRGSGLLARVRMLVKPSQLYDPSVKDLVIAEDKYAIIEVIYTSYRKEAFNEAIFDTGTYIKQNKKTYTPVPPYDSYQLFVGSN